MENNTKVPKEGGDKVIRELTKDEDETKEFKSNTTTSVTLKSNSIIYPPLPRQNCVKQEPSS